MFKNLVTFNLQTHARKKIRPLENFRFAANSYITPLIISEFTRASMVYPIIFLKDDNGQFGTYALLGLEPQKNLFVDNAGNWNAPYIPAMIRRYPFSLGKTQKEDGFVLCIDEASGLLSDTTGSPLVMPDGQPGDIVRQAREYLTELYKTGILTDRFCQDMAERNLLTPFSVQVKKQDGKEGQNIEGCFSINEKQLEALPDQDFLQLRKRGALPLIYAHLNSLTNIEQIVYKHKALKS